MTSMSTSVGTTPWLVSAARSLSAVALIWAVVKLLGFAEKQLLAWYFGATAIADAYFVTIAAVNTMFFLWKELMDPVLLPFFVSKSTSGRPSSAVGGLQLASVVIVGVGVATVICGFLWTDAIASWLAPGLSTEHLATTSSILRIGLIAVPIAGLSALTLVILNGSRRFALAACGDVAQKTALLVSIVVAKASANPLLALGVAPVAGAAAKIAVHLPAARSWLRRCFSTWHGLPEERHELRRLTTPLLIAALFSQSRELFENHYTSRVGVGAIAAHLYAKRLAELPLTLAAQTVTTVSFPHMAQLAAGGNRKQALQVSGTCIRSLLILFLPLGAIVFLVSEQLITLVFARGAFGSTAVAASVSALRIYAIGLPLLAVEPVVIATFYSLADTRTPVAAGILAALVEIALMALFVDSLKIEAIAGALVVAKAVKLLALGTILWRLTPSRIVSGLVKPSLRMGLPFLACLAGGAIVLRQLRTSDDPIGSSGLSTVQLVGEVVVLGGTVSLIFFACWALMSFDLAGQMSRILNRRRQ